MATLAAEKELQHIGESCGCADHDHDLIHDLSKRLDALWRYDQYIANAESKPTLHALWRDLKKQEISKIKRDDGRFLAQVEREDVLFLDGDHFADVVLLDIFHGVLDAVGIDVEAACLAAVLLGGRYGDAAVAAAEIPNYVVLGDLGHLQH